jgi:hypothetical protein
LEGEDGIAAGTTMEGDLTYGQTVANEVTSPFGDSWTFSGDEGDVVSIDTVGFVLEDTYLELYDPEGVLLIEDDDSGADYFARISGIRLPESGTYTVVIRGYNGASGTYELSLLQGRISQDVEVDFGDPVDQGEVVFGEIVEGNVETEDGDLWAFTGERGILVRIEIEGASLEDTYLELIDPQGRLAAFDDDSGTGYSSMIDDFLLQEDGLYRIIVRGYGGETGTYTLEITQTGTAELDPGGGADTASVATISNAVCDSFNTYFVLTIDGDAARTSSQQFRIAPRGSGAALAQLIPVVGPQMEGEVGQALYDVTISINGSIIVSGSNTIPEISTAIMEEFDRLAVSGVSTVEISYQGNQGDLKLLVWGTHSQSGGIQVSTYWGEQENSTGAPAVPEGMAGELIVVVDPCN